MANDSISSSFTPQLDRLYEPRFFVMLASFLVFADVASVLILEHPLGELSQSLSLDAISFMGVVASVCVFSSVVVISPIIFNWPIRLAVLNFPSISDTLGFGSGGFRNEFEECMDPEVARVHAMNKGDDLVYKYAMEKISSNRECSRLESACLSYFVFANISFLLMLSGHPTVLTFIFNDNNGLPVFLGGAAVLLVTAIYIYSFVIGVLRAGGLLGDRYRMVFIERHKADFLRGIASRTSVYNKTEQSNEAAT